MPGKKFTKKKAKHESQLPKNKTAVIHEAPKLDVSQTVTVPVVPEASTVISRVDLFAQGLQYVLLES